MTKEQITHLQDMIDDFMSQATSECTIESSSNGRFTDEKINRLDDKIYRLERNISDHDSRIRKLEMKVR